MLGRSPKAPWRAAGGPGRGLPGARPDGRRRPPRAPEGTGWVWQGPAGAACGEHASLPSLPSHLRGALAEVVTSRCAPGEGTGPWRDREPGSTVCLSRNRPAPRCCRTNADPPQNQEPTKTPQNPPLSPPTASPEGEFQLFREKNSSRRQGWSCGGRAGRWGAGGAAGGPDNARLHGGWNPLAELCASARSARAPCPDSAPRRY